MTLPPLPDELKYINGFLQRAQELRNRDPIIAYYCNFYSVKLALEKGTKSKESKLFLAKLLDALEEEKKSIHDNEAFTDNVVGEAYVENFALKVFTNADNEDRAGKASKKTAKNFLAAAIFLELLKVFGPLSSETEEKIKYAKWKATDIIKALKEGQIPVPGPPGGEPQPPNESYAANPSENIHSIDQFPSAPLLIDSPSESHIENDRQPFPPFHSSQSSDLITPPGKVDLFNQPVGPPLPPKINETFGGIHHQPPSSFPSNPPQPPQNYVQPYNPPPPPQNYVQPYSPPTYQPTTPTPTYQPTTPTYQPTTPTYQPTTPTFQPTTQTSLPISQQNVNYSFTSHNLTEIDPNVISTAQKHCKWAISALNYNDIKTAVENMHKALAMLEPYNHK